VFAACALSLASILQEVALDFDESGLVGYVEHDGEEGFSENEKVYTTNIIKSGTTVHLIDNCNTW
jgi:hypothetical protein